MSFINIAASHLINDNASSQYDVSLEYGLSDALQVELAYQKQTDTSWQVATSYLLSEHFSFPFQFAIELEVEQQDGETGFETALLLSHQWQTRHTLHSNLSFETEDDANQTSIGLAYHYQVFEALSVISEYATSKENTHHTYNHHLSLGGIYALSDDGHLGLAIARHDEDNDETAITLKYSLEW